MLPLAPDFVCGAVRFTDRDPQDQVRIVIPVRFAHQEKILATVDTGSPYSILDPSIADRLGIDLAEGYRPEGTVQILNFNLEGWICRIPVELEASEGMGTGLEFRASVFIPELGPGLEWSDHFNVIGLQNFLFRIRFAVDPDRDNQLFYFGGPV